MIFKYFNPPYLNPTKLIDNLAFGSPLKKLNFKIVSELINEIFQESNLLGRSGKWQDYEKEAEQVFNLLTVKMLSYYTTGYDLFITFKFLDIIDVKLK